NQASPLPSLSRLTSAPGFPALTVRGKSLIRIRARLQACRKCHVMNAPLQIAEKLKLRIRASLQRCRKFFELRCPFRGRAPKTEFFSNLFRRWFLAPEFHHRLLSLRG